MTKEQVIDRIQTIRGHMHISEHETRCGNETSATLQLWEAFRQLRELLGVIAPMPPDT